MELTLLQVINMSEAVNALLETSFNKSKLMFDYARTARVFNENYSDFIKTEQELIKRFNIQNILEEGGKKIKNPLTEEETSQLNQYIKERNNLLEATVDINFPEIFETDVNDGGPFNGRHAALMQELNIIKE